MRRLAGFSYRQIARRLRTLGFAFDRQAAGSYEIWFHAETDRYTTIPVAHSTPVRMLHPEGRFMAIADGKKRVMLTLDEDVLARLDALCRERGQHRGHVVETILRRSLARLGKPPSKSPPDPRQLDIEEATAVAGDEVAPVPELSEADLRAGVEAAASLGARIDVEAAHADWLRYVAAMDVPLYSPVGHWITFCRRRARES